MPGPKECTKSPKSIGRRLVSKAGENSQPSAASHSPAVPRVAALSVPIQEKELEHKLLDSKPGHHCTHWSITKNFAFTPFCR